MTSTNNPWGPPPPWWGPRPTGAPRVHPTQMRIDNAARAQVTDALCKHFADGRLDEAEFNDRAARAAAAKTQADLAPLLADLPSLDTPHPEAYAMPRRSHPILWAIALVVFAPLVIAGVLAIVGGVFGLAASVVGGVLHGLFPLAVVVGVIYLLARRRGPRTHHHHRYPY